MKSNVRSLCITGLGDHPAHQHGNGPQGLCFQPLATASSELKKPPGEEVKPAEI